MPDIKTANQTESTYLRVEVTPTSTNLGGIAKMLRQLDDVVTLAVKLEARREAPTEIAYPRVLRIQYGSPFLIFLSVTGSAALIGLLLFLIHLPRHRAEALEGASRAKDRARLHEAITDAIIEDLEARGLGSNHVGSSVTSTAADSIYDLALYWPEAEIVFEIPSATSDGS